MRILPAGFHAIDYLVGLLVASSPWLFGYVDTLGGGLHMLVGIVILGSAAMTDFDFGIVRAIPMSVHLMLDGLIGAVALVSPWVLGVEAYGGLHVALGLFEIAAAAMTSTRAGRTIAA